MVNHELEGSRLKISSRSELQSRKVDQVGNRCDPCSKLLYVLVSTCITKIEFHTIVYVIIIVPRVAPIGFRLCDLGQVQLDLRPEALRVVENLLPPAEMCKLAGDHLKILVKQPMSK